MFTLGYLLGITILLIGIVGFISNNENLILLIISLELILAAIGLIFVHFSFILDDLIGATIALYLIPLAGAESALALALLVAYYPLRGNLNIG